MGDFGGECGGEGGQARHHGGGKRRAGRIHGGGRRGAARIHGGGRRAAARIHGGGGQGMGRGFNAPLLLGGEVGEALAAEARRPADSAQREERNRQQRRRIGALLLIGSGIPRAASPG